MLQGQSPFKILVRSCPQYPYIHALQCNVGPEAIRIEIWHGIAPNITYCTLKNITVH